MPFRPRITVRSQQQGTQSNAGAPPLDMAPDLGRVDRLSPFGSIRAARLTPGADLTPAPASPPTQTPDPAPPAAVIPEVQIHPLRLRLLLEIERTGSISTAAETCRIGQPSASMHLRTLEAAIGHRLVTRSGRGSCLTAAGKVVALHAARVLGTLDSMRRALDALDARNGGELILAASLTPSFVLIPEVLRRFSDRFPSVSVELRTVPSESVVREVVRGGADLGIAGEIPTADPVSRTEIFMDELVGIAPAGLLRLDDGCVSLGEFARNSLLIGSEGSSTRIVTERTLARADYRPARTWVFDSYEAIKRAVAGGVGVSFMSRQLVQKEIDRGELVAFRVFGLEPMARPIQLVQPAARELTPEGAAFVTLLADAPWSVTERRQPAPTGAMPA